MKSPVDEKYLQSFKVNKKLYGGANAKQVKKLQKIADVVEQKEPIYAAMTDEELASQTQVLRSRLAAGETLDDILTDAYAVCREASKRVLHQRHFYVQILGGIALHQGRICQMSTGEGKTLTETLPAYLNALSGNGVHIVTVNEYLAQRDKEWMGKVFKFLGLTVGVTLNSMSGSSKRAAYACDITYGTNSEFGFDYLRDNMATSRDECVQRGLGFVIIDEVDSILIDEARTPLLISSPSNVDTRIYYQADQYVRMLTPSTNVDVEGNVITTKSKHQPDDENAEVSPDEADQDADEIAEEDADENIETTPDEEVEEDIDEVDEGDDDQDDIFPKANLLKRLFGKQQQVEPNGDYVVNQKEKTVFLTPSGMEKLSMYYNDPLLFGEDLDSIEEREEQMQDLDELQEDDDSDIVNTDEVLDEKELAKREEAEEKAKQEEILNYEREMAAAERRQFIQQLINNALYAHALLHRDDDYIVEYTMENKIRTVRGKPVVVKEKCGKVVLIDSYTGRKMEGRRLSKGLHQAVEAKEGVIVQQENKTSATVTVQNYFRLYRKMSGMTGTAKTEEAEFNSIYNIDVVAIPTHMPTIRKDENDLIFSTRRGKMQAIINEIVNRHATGQPLLVGTTTVEGSEELSKLLTSAKIPHNVLNAKLHEKEAEIIAQAGRLGAVTIATNMAGRGTDILLGGNPEFLAKQKMKAIGYDSEQVEQAASFIKGDEQVEKDRKVYTDLYATYAAETSAERQKVLDAGGLCVIGTERHESRRIDNQLRGRSGRQGDPGTSMFFVSTEDDMIRIFNGEMLSSVMNFIRVPEGMPIQHKLVSRAIEISQKRLEARHFSVRKHVLQYDDVDNQQRRFIYQERNRILDNENVHEDIVKLADEYALAALKDVCHKEDSASKWDFFEVNMNLYYPHRKDIGVMSNAYFPRPKIVPLNILDDHPEDIYQTLFNTVNDYLHKLLAALERCCGDSAFFRKYKRDILKKVNNHFGGANTQITDDVMEKYVDITMRRAIKGLTKERPQFSKYSDDWDIRSLNKYLYPYYHPIPILYPDEVNSAQQAHAILVKLCCDHLEQINAMAQAALAETDPSKQIDYYAVERFLFLNSIDDLWVDHIDALDELKRGVGLQSIGQRDPLMTYRSEAYEMFQQLNSEIAVRTINRLLFGNLRRMGERLRFLDERRREREQQEAPCPCGSGKKYKDCCGKKEEPDSAPKNKGKKAKVEKQPIPDDPNRELTKQEQYALKREQRKKDKQNKK